MNRNDKNEKTTLTVFDVEDGVNKVDLPVGRLVRFEENDASLFIVEAASGCASCALNGANEEETLFHCEAFACCESRRRDGTDVILRRVEGSDDGALAERALTICRRRYGPFVDLNDLRRALAVYNVNRSVEIKLPDGRKFAVADVRLDRDSGEPVEDAAVLLIAGAEREARNEL
ncbi:MAG: hypothetical protein IJ991_00070 [Thermoguttaceae bacterium]|nr:hypothetical protein [Thermoguttaceae bacterium]